VTGYAGDLTGKGLSEDFVRSKVKASVFQRAKQLIGNIRDVLFVGPVLKASVGNTLRSFHFFLLEPNRHRKLQVLPDISR
jgi:hypothetical protein